MILGTIITAFTPDRPVNASEEYNLCTRCDFIASGVQGKDIFQTIPKWAQVSSQKRPGEKRIFQVRY